jgi:hypothetical protein
MRPPREHVRQCRLARAVGSHDGVHFARVDREIETLQNLFPIDAGVQIFDFE